MGGASASAVDRRGAQRLALPGTVKEEQQQAEHDDTHHCRRETRIGNRHRVEQLHIAAAGLDQPTSIIGCYPKAPGFIKAHARLLRTVLTQSETKRDTTRVLFSAHGLPKKIVATGDPYEWQVQETAAAVAQELAARELDWRVCYQSKVGPLEWIGPSTDTIIKQEAQKHKIIVVVPVAFVSEHSETLVELDIEYKKLAIENGSKDYIRIPAVTVNKDFINSLKSSILKTSGGNRFTSSINCPEKFKKCPRIQNI